MAALWCGAVLGSQRCVGSNVLWVDLCMRTRAHNPDPFASKGNYLLSLLLLVCVTHR